MNRNRAKKRHIRNPEKWIGKYVRHLANWQDYQWAYDKNYLVCEWTGKLMHVEDEYFPYDDERETLGDVYDPCYAYCEEGVIQMLEYVEKQQKTAA